jgi:hypothetical protein
MAALLRRRKHAPDPRAAEALAEIESWRTWFVNAHAQRLRDDGVSGDAFTQEHGKIVALADAITERMRSDFLSRH